MGRTATVIENNRRRRRRAMRVYECGRRVHGWSLTHDIVVGAAHNFPAYWAKAQADGARRRQGGGTGGGTGG